LGTCSNCGYSSNPYRNNYRIRFNAIVTPTNSGILAESGQFEIVSGGPESQVSVKVIGGTSTVLVGTPAAATAKATNNNGITSLLVA
jgi:hypothetical protein